MPKMSGGYKNRNVKVQVDGKIYELDNEGKFDCDQKHVEHFKSVGFKRVFDFGTKKEEVEPKKVEVKVEEIKTEKEELKEEVKVEEKVEDKKTSKFSYKKGK